MRHLLVSREYPPAPYPAGGIGQYVATIARLLADAGETVHVVAQRWSGAPRAEERSADGRLVVHRVSLDGPLADTFPAQAFAERAARVIEAIVERERIDVIEAQEWEGPLAHFLLRRALGLGPGREPPCIVHLHSPTELIFRHNEWSTARPDYLPTVACEDYAIGAADAWLCPSRYLARQAESHYGLTAGSITVIALPVGDTPPLARAPEVWTSGSICFVGRLEPRKGVVEWVDAAVAAAARHASLTFDFVGADLSLRPGVSVRSALERRIPDALRPRFRFIGPLARAELREHLAHARVAVVPSRWENFPNTCVEAMASGLPVIASPDGGMIELVDDGVTGWIAPSCTPTGLAEALERALATPPETLAELGAAAAVAVRERCDNRAIVERHLAFRREVAERGAHRSRELPPSLPWTRPAAHAATARARERDATGVAVVLVVDAATAASNAGGRVVDQALDALAAQTRPAATRAIVCAAPASEATQGALARARELGWSVAVGEATAETTSALDAALDAAPNAALGADRPLLGVALLDARDVVAPTLLERSEAVLRTQPRVGIVTATPDDADAWHLAPCPTLPFQLVRDGTGPVAVFRAESLRAVGGVRSEIPPSFQRWDAVNAVMAAGWVAVRYPEQLVRHAPAPDGSALRDDGDERIGRARARRRMLERVPDAVAAGAPDLILHGEFLALEAVSRPPVPPPRLTLASLPPNERLAWALAVVRDLAAHGVARPGRAMRWVAPRVVRAARRLLRLLSAPAAAS